MTAARQGAPAARMMERPEGKEVLGASAEAPNLLEQAALLGLDVDKLNQLAEGLFVLNGRNYGPVPGAYVVVCLAAGQTWCVGQLNADRAKPLLLFEDLIFGSPDLAVAEAERLKRARGEASPRRSI